MFGIYNRLHLPVSAPNREVVKAARRKIKKAQRRDPAFREARKQFYRAMLDCHHKAWCLYMDVNEGFH